MELDLEKSIRKIDIDERTELKLSRNLEIEQKSTEDNSSTGNDQPGKIP